MTRTLALLLTCVACSAPKDAPPTAATPDSAAPRDSSDTGSSLSSGDEEDLPYDKVGGGSLLLRFLTEDGTLVEEMEISGVPEANLDDVWPGMSRGHTGLNEGAGIYEQPGVDLSVAVFQSGLWALEDYAALDGSSACATDWHESCGEARWNLYFEYSEDLGAYFFNQASLDFSVLEYHANPRLDEGASGGEVEGGPAEATSGSAYALGPQIINSDNSIDEEAEIELMKAMIEARWPGLHRMEFVWALDPEVAIRN